MTSLRKWWAKVFLGTVSLTGLFLFAAFFSFSSTSSESWVAWIPFLFCWGGILSVGIAFMATIGFVIESPKPHVDTQFWHNAPWALIGGLLAFGIPLSEWLWSCCNQGNIYFLGCFGPLLFLMGFAIGGRLGRTVLIFLIAFPTIFIGSILHPTLGDTGTLLVIISIMIVGSGLIFYWDYSSNKIDERNASHSFMAYPHDNSLDKLQHWPRDGKEWLIKNPPPWLAEELADPEVTEKWLTDSLDSRSRFSYGWSLEPQKKRKKQ